MIIQTNKVLFIYPANCLTNKDKKTYRMFVRNNYQKNNYYRKNFILQKSFCFVPFSIKYFNSNPITFLLLEQKLKNLNYLKNEKL